MLGQNDHYLKEILEKSKCTIGRANPHYRISDESFCAQSLLSLERYSMSQRKYGIGAVINFFIIGFGK